MRLWPRPDRLDGSVHGGKIVNGYPIAARHGLVKRHDVHACVTQRSKVGSSLPFHVLHHDACHPLLVQDAQHFRFSSASHVRLAKDDAVSGSMGRLEDALGVLAVDRIVGRRKDNAKQSAVPEL